jgi:putative DNA primase/helicase
MTDQAIYTGPTTEDIARIPADLKALPQWILWRGEDKVNQRTGEVKLNKVPYDPRTERKADTTNPDTWGSFEECWAALPLALERWEQEKPEDYRGGGLGFVFTSGDSYVGIDLDKCRDSASGEIAPWAETVITTLDSYTELTPSRRGFHVLAQGKLPPGGRRNGNVEMYSEGRFFTMTGWHYPGTPPAINVQENAIVAVYWKYFDAPRAPKGKASEGQEGQASTLDDTTLLKKARSAKNKEKFNPLWEGDDTGYASPSEADLALCIRLAFWTQDPAQIDRLFRESGLWRDKWDELRGEFTYGEMTIQEALARQTTHYTPREDAKRRRNGHTSASTTTATTPPPAVDPAKDLDTVSPCTHVANARRIARKYAQTLRYVLGRGWIVWTGQFWRPDPTADGALATGFVSGLARSIAEEAAILYTAAANTPGEEERKVLYARAEARGKWAYQSENASVIAAGLKLAKRDLLIEHDRIDSNPWLLNCQNGTIDLRTGMLQPHNPTDLITHLAPVTYDIHATCPTWEKFLGEVFDGDTAMVKFLQRALGWSLTGVVQDRALFFLYGSQGNNGKTTLVETYRDVLGTWGEESFGYARKVDVTTFMKSKTYDDNLRKVCQLAGARFTYSSEIDEEHRLNEQLIKDMTGGDTLEARRLYNEPFTFKPTFKPWMYGNHKPEIRGTDDALWSRVKLVPFEVSFADRIDLKLPDKLRAELSGILNWAIQGCLAWQQEGLKPPQKVQTATQGYREEQDTIGRFIRECCQTGKKYMTCKASRLYAAYERWAHDNNHEVLSQKRFGGYLTAHGYPGDDNATGGGIIRINIDLLKPKESKKD